jgi:hypothetical protein
MSTQDAAIAAARRGWAVFPCRPGGKQPAVPDSWETRACADPDRVERFWPPGRHNVGIACGPSRLVVVDLDTHGDLPGDWRQPGIYDGRDVLAQLCEWARQPWPVTYWVATPSGGWHLYFAAPEDVQVRNSAGLVGPQVDVRGAGGYVVGAGSAVDGKPYEVLDDMPPAQLPGWIARMITRKPPQAGRPGPDAAEGHANLGGLADTVRCAQRGQQTNTLAWAAFRLREEIQRGRASIDDGELLVQAGLDAGMEPESYVRYQVRHVLEASR